MAIRNFYRPYDKNGKILRVVQAHSKDDVFRHFERQNITLSKVELIITAHKIKEEFRVGGKELDFWNR